MSRLEALFSADKLVRDQYAALTGRIAQENSALMTLQTRLADAQGAAVRRKELQTERDDTCRRCIRLCDAFLLSGVDSGRHFGVREDAWPFAEGKIT
jgi:hypothetical protein